ncbi:MAG: PorV/PorQ family protein [Actinobacteria bacterium]|nr:PorV/PorQ family protein [Actinomycetota bacterium]
MKLRNIFRISIFMLATVPIMAMGQYYQNIDYGLHPAKFERLGQAGWQFLKIPTNARQAGMGGVVAAIGRGDASYSFTNPASINDVENLELSLSSMNWIADLKYQSGALVKNFGNWGTFGFNFLYLDYGEMIRTEYQEVLNNGLRTGLTEPKFDLGTFGAIDIALGLSYSRRVTDRLQIGGNLRYLREELADAVVSNWAIDIGTLFYTGIKTFRIALIGRNFGPDVTFAKWSEQIAVPPASVRMPMNLIIGAAIDILEGKNGNPHQMTLAADFVHPNDGPEKVNVGTEFSFHNFMMLRAGYRFNYDEEGLTLGAGLKVKTSGTMEVTFNYSYWAFGVLGNTNMFSVGFGL